MRKKLAVFFSLPLVLLNGKAFAGDAHWNGTECVTCPDGPFTPENSQPFSSTGAPPPSGQPAPIQSGTIGVAAEDFVRLPQTPSMLYFIVGPVKAVDREQHRVLIRNRQTHKDHSVLVFDPIVHSLKERNVVEVWLKPGSEKAEKIRRLS